MEILKLSSLLILFYFNYWKNGTQSISLEWNRKYISILVVKIPLKIYVWFCAKCILIIFDLNSAFHLNTLHDVIGIIFYGTLTWLNACYNWFHKQSMINLLMFDDTYMCSDNCLSPVQCRAIIWTNDGVLLIEPLGLNFSEIWSKRPKVSFKKGYLKMLSVKSLLSHLSLSVLTAMKIHLMLLFHPIYI